MGLAQLGTGALSDCVGRFGNGDYFVSGNLTFSGSADIASDQGQNDRVYFQVGGNIGATGSSHFHLKGRPAYDDIVFHIPRSRTNRTVSLTTTFSSQIIGSIYAPGLGATVDLYGNDGGGYRVTRGGSLSKRGGRIIAFHVHLYPVAGTTFGADFPPNVVDDIREPLLVR